jgi:hypothetical protein
MNTILPGGVLVLLLARVPEVIFKRVEGAAG